VTAANPRYFIVTSQGVSATRWLAFALASHPEVFGAHGHFAIDSVASEKFQQEKSKDDVDALSNGNATRNFYKASKIGDIFARYRSLRPDANAYGNAHSYTLDDLVRRHIGKARDPGFALANVVRHPVSYIDSHFSLVRKAETNPDVYRNYQWNLFPQALAEFRELFLLDCPDFPEFLAFAASCYSVLIVARDLDHETVRHYRMESLTTDCIALAAFCQILTGHTYSREELSSHIAEGAINRHRQKSASTDDREIYNGWARWKKDIASVMISEPTLKKFEKVGYDVNMLRERAGKESESAPARCLADSLKAMDENHPLLTLVRGDAVASKRSAAQPVLLESMFGYNIVQFGTEFFALSKRIGEVHVTDGAQALVERHGNGRVMVADTIEEARKCIRRAVGLEPGKGARRWLFRFPRR
jgi:hypothetical protein